MERRVALITGAASGIGRHLALQLAAQGATVAALDRNGEALATLATQLADKSFTTVIVDVTQAKEVRAAVAQVEAQLGPIDLLIASAGVGIETSAFDLRAEDLELLINVNLLGVSNTIAAVLPGMLQRGRGHLVAMSSLASYRGMPLMAGYCATKAGVNALMDGLRVELRAKNIHCTTICPGWVRTPMTDKLDIPMADLLEPEEAAWRILEAIRRRRSFYAFPPRLVRQVRLLRLLPLAISDWLVAQVYHKLKKK